MFQIAGRRSLNADWRHHHLLGLAEVKHQSSRCLKLILSGHDGIRRRILNLQDTHGGFTSEVYIQSQASRCSELPLRRVRAWGHNDGVMVRAEEHMLIQCDPARSL